MPIPPCISSSTDHVTTSQEVGAKDTVDPFGITDLFYFKTNKMLHFSVSGHKWVFQLQALHGSSTHLLIKYSTRHVLAHKGLHRQIHWKYFSFSEYIKWTSLIDSMPSLAFSITYWINEQWFPSQRLQYDSLNSDNPIRDFWTKLRATVSMINKKL